MSDRDCDCMDVMPFNLQPTEVNYILCSTYLQTALRALGSPGGYFLQGRLFLCLPTSFPAYQSPSERGLL